MSFMEITTIKMFTFQIKKFWEAMFLLLNKKQTSDSSLMFIAMQIAFALFIYAFKILFVTGWS